MTQTPEQFARKLGRVSKAVKTQQSRAIGARALVTKRYIVEAAATRNRKARPAWVQYRVKGDTALIRLRGGMAHLTELGSYKAPEGWDEVPKSSTARRRRNAARAGVELSEHRALRTPYGPFASVHHPAIGARHFWRKGLEASRVPGRKAYQKVVNQTITSALRH